MNAATFYDRIVTPAADFCDAIAPQTTHPLARLLLVAIAGQESGWTWRRQLAGPARSFWQAERGGACTGVLSHPASRPIMAAACEALEIACDPGSIYTAIEYCDPLAYVMARCILWPDPRLLPQPGDLDGAWQLYVSLWRPGKPDRSRWLDRYPVALDAWQRATARGEA